jgi:hypothetical protein
MIFCSDCRNRLSDTCYENLFVCRACAITYEVEVAKKTLLREEGRLI